MKNFLKNFLKSRIIQAALIALIGSLVITFGPQLISKKVLSETQIHVSVPSSDDYVAVEMLDRADCWNSSLATGRSDAYRCGTENFIYDPCFSNPFYSSRQVVGCPITETKFKYFVTEGLSTSSDPYPSCTPPECGRPWLVELEDGTKCNAVTGMHNVVIGRFIDYSCDGKNGYEFLSQPFINDGPLYKIDCSRGNTISICSIKAMWY